MVTPRRKPRTAKKKAAPVRKERYYLNNPSLKRAGEIIEFTPDQAIEYAKCALDPLYFIENYCKIVSLDGGIILFNMWDFQKEFVRTLHENRKVIGMMPRQTSKTTCVAGYLCWYVIFNANKNCAVLANKAKAATEVLSRIKLMIQNLPRWMQQGIVTWNKGDIELDNGSKIFTAATSGSAVTGKSLNLCYCDELALVSPTIAEEMMASVFPTLSSGETTKIIMTSTPRGKNIFWRYWVDAEAGINGFVNYRANWYDVPTRTEKWLNEQRRVLKTDTMFAREILCSFESSVKTLVSQTTLATLKQHGGTTPIKESDNTKVFKEPEKGRSYVALTDIARGREGDYSTTTIIDVTAMPYEVACTNRDNTIEPYSYPNVMHPLLKHYNNAYTLVEINDAGSEVANILGYEMEYENMFQSNIMTLGQSFKGNPYIGLRTTRKTKRLGCAALKGILEEGNLIVHDSNIIEELDSFVKTGVSYAAEEGYHDDLVMTLVHFAWLTQQRYFASLFTGTDSGTRDVAFKREIKTAEDEILSLFGPVATAVVDIPIQELDMIPDDFKWMFDTRLQTKTDEEWKALWNHDD